LYHASRIQKALQVTDTLDLQAPEELRDSSFPIAELVQWRRILGPVIPWLSA